MEGLCQADSDFSLNAQLVQRKIQDDLIRSLQNFDDVYKDVGPTYLSGTFAGQGSFTPRISPLIEKRAQIISCALTYKTNLSLFHSLGVIVPAPRILPKVKAFYDCLKHCTNPDKWDFFAKLTLILREFNTFVLDDRSSPMAAEAYNTELNKHIGGMVDLVSQDICTAVIAREDAIGEHRADPIPLTSSPLSAISEKLDDVRHEVVEIRAVLPQSVSVDDLKGVDAEKIKELQNAADPFVGKENACEFLKGLVQVVLGDKTLLLEGKPIKRTKQAFTYIWSNVNDAKSPHGELIALFRKVANHYGWNTFGTVYQKIKNIGSETLTAKGLRRDAKRRRTKRLVDRDLSEAARELPGNIR